MNKTIGINNDYWHGILPFVVLTVQMPLAFSLTICTILALICLQFINEWLQLIRVGKKNADNSIRDTRFFAVGLLLGLVAGTVIKLILVNV